MQWPVGFVVNVQSALDPAGPQAARIARLWWIFLDVCIVVYVVVITLLLIALFRAHRRKDPVADSDERSLKIAVSSGAALTLVTLIILLFVSVRTGSAIGHFATKGATPLEIDVTGHQWWWEVKYPNSFVPAYSITTANEIHIPTGSPVLLKLDTRDVIHSLWIPNLHGKRDLIPGRENKFQIQADRAGIFRAQCAEYCGTQHAHMALTVIAEPPAQFAKWQSQQQLGAPEPMTPLAKKGRDVFLSLPCANCHNILGTDAYGTLGPDLTHVMSRKTLGAGTLLTNRGSLAGWIQNPQAIKPGNQMPLNVLSSEELNALLAYMETLQ